MAIGHSLSSCVVVAAGLATVVWWGLPRLYGGAHAKTPQTDWHGQGAESGEWMRTGAFWPLQYHLSCRAFVSCDDGDGDEVEREPVSCCWQVVGQGGTGRLIDPRCCR